MSRYKFRNDYFVLFVLIHVSALCEKYSFGVARIYFGRLGNISQSLCLSFYQAYQRLQGRIIHIDYFRWTCNFCRFIVIEGFNTMSGNQS